MERLMAKVNKDGPIPEHRPELGPCWVWGGTGGRYGHGLFRDDDSKTRNTHRWLYERLVGAVPEGLELDHLCRNPPCCNPTHLEPVTHQVNVHRGISPMSANAAKASCPKGHPFDRVNSQGSRECTTCRRDAARARRRANPEPERQRLRDWRALKKAQGLSDATQAMTVQ
jgi:hypothetical protein